MLLVKVSMCSKMCRLSAGCSALLRCQSVDFAVLVECVHDVQHVSFNCRDCCGADCSGLSLLWCDQLLLGGRHNNLGDLHHPSCGIQVGVQS